MALSPPSWQPRAVTIVEESRVSPPPGSVPETCLPLTFFDLLWCTCCPMQRLYFYRFPHSPRHFSDALVPSLKRSLSLALLRFFPFAGNLLSPPPPAKPFLHFAPGDSVPFAVAESAAGDFDALFARDGPRGVRDIQPFAPALPPARRRAENGALAFPLMAVQVTFFPGAGFVLGVTFCHVACDGKSFHGFMKYWASVCKHHPGGGEESTPPFYGRDAMKRLEGAETAVLKDFWAWASAQNEAGVGPDETLAKNLDGKVRASFVIGRPQIDELKRWVGDHVDFGSARVSAFVVTCALVWACVLKSEGEFSGVEEEPCFFVFVADCRDRLEFPVPSEYFGNCLAFAIVSAKRGELVGPDGVAKAAKAIGARVRALESGVMEGAETWLSDWTEISNKYHNVTVAGSPRLGVYETDFGWGRPAKTEVVHTDVSGAFSLCERRDGEPGVELSLALTEPKMKHFSALFEASFDKLMG